MQEEKGCLVSGMEHKYEFEKAETGITYQKCSLCSAVLWIYEDASL